MLTHKLPCDAVWLDIEMSDGKKYFTWDKRRFPTPATMLERVKANKQRLITIIDPHIKDSEPDYFLLKEGFKRDLFVHDVSGHPYVGHCWPASSHWLDYMNPDVTKLLEEIYCGQYHKDQTDFIWTDSWVHIWNDMNEPACFMPTDKTMPKSNLHHFGNGRVVEHRDVHNLYGHYNSKATHTALLKRTPEERPFILTRSFNAGT
jgi:alpha-glucosidase (family GH31 glycosyl hydrolase)